MALAARIASPQGVAFHTSTDTAPAERGARRPSLRRKEPIYFHKNFNDEEFFLKDSTIEQPRVRRRRNPKSRSLAQCSLLSPISSSHLPAPTGAPRRWRFNSQTRRRLVIGKVQAAERRGGWRRTTMDRSWKSSGRWRRWSKRLLRQQRGAMGAAVSGRCVEDECKCCCGARPRRESTRAATC